MFHLTIVIHFISRMLSLGYLWGCICFHFHITPQAYSVERQSILHVVTGRPRASTTRQAQTSVADLRLAEMSLEEEDEGQSVNLKSSGASSSIKCKAVIIGLSLKEREA